MTATHINKLVLEFSSALTVIVALLTLSLLSSNVAFSQVSSSKVDTHGRSKCESSEVASATREGSILLPGNESIENNLWTFCDGFIVSERLITKESDKDFENNTLEPIESAPNMVRISSHNEGPEIHRLLFRTKDESPEWVYVSRIGGRTSTFRGNSLIHVLLLEKLRRCGQHP
jgi:hypothetical protein